MSEKQGICFGTVFLYIVLIPFVYFIIDDSILLIGIVIISVPLGLIGIMTYVEKKSAGLFKYFSKTHSQENIKWHGVAEKYGDPNTGIIVVTEQGIFFIQKIKGNIAEYEMLFENVSEINCDVQLSVMMNDETFMKFKIFDANELKRIIM